MQPFRLLPACTLALFVLSGCASTPETLRGEYASLEPAHADETDIGTDVRWGGKLLGIHPEASRTCYEILALPLDRVARPMRRQLGGQRFLACRNQFIDPATVARDRLVTVTGTLTGFESRMIGDFAYEYPVLRLDGVHVWYEPAPTYGYDPFTAPNTADATAAYWIRSKHPHRKYPIRPEQFLTDYR